MTEKTWLTADRLLEDSYRLANKVIEAGFAPSHIVGIWRGGAPVGIAVQELLAYNGIEVTISRSGRRATPGSTSRKRKCGSMRWAI